MFSKVLAWLGLAVIAVAFGAMVANFASQEVYDLLARRPEIVLWGLCVGGGLVVIGALLNPGDVDERSQPRRQ